jgi:cholesterol transport system auxiliary component
MNTSSPVRLGRLCAAGLVLTLAGGCDALRPTTTAQPSFYTLDRARGSAPPASRPTAPAAAPTLIINPPHAAAGFDSQRIIYVREAHKLEYFVHSKWVDPPARMLAPLLAAAVENTGTFRAVVLTPSAAAGDLRLDTEVVRLQHEFQTRPSRVRFTLRAYIVENSTRRVLAWREFDETAPAASDDPYGGVLAANRAVQAALDNLAAFCAETARGSFKAGAPTPVPSIP